MTELPGRESKHILIIVQNLPVPFDRRVWQESTTLQRAGYQVSVICPKKKIYTNSFEVLDGVEIYRYPLIYEADQGVAGYFFEFIYCWLVSFYLSLRIFLKKRFHVIHACNPPDTYFALALFFKLFGVKFVFDHHDLSPEMFVAKGKKKGSILYQGLILLERLTFRSADMVIAVNESHKEIAVQRGSIPSEKIVIVRSGPSVSWATKFSGDGSLKKGKKNLALYLGEMCAQDGVDHLLEAIAYYKTTYDHDTEFVFVGGGPDQQRLRTLSSQMGLDDMVYFTGRVSDEDLWKYLSTADVCIDPDPKSEWSNLSTMNKIIEYMSFGRPIVAFDLLENRRSALDAAVYVEPNDIRKLADAIRSLIDNAAKRDSLSSYGKQRFIEILSWENSAKILVASYDSLFSLLK